MTTIDPEQQWHLDKKVPVALILTLAAQTIAIGVWVGSLSSRVSELENKAARALDVGERVVRVEQDTIHIRKSLERVEQKLGRQYPD